MKRKDQFFKEFVSEAEEIIETLSQNLLEMETSEDRTTIRPDIINAIFRGAHSLKGMSGMVGLKKVSSVSHHLEDLLDKLRMGKLGLSDSVLEVLQAGIQIIRSLVQSIDSGKGEATDTDAIVQKMKDVMANGAPQGESVGLHDLNLDPDLLKVLTEYETHRFKENIRLGAHFFEIIAQFPMDSFDRDLGSLNASLQNFGEIITTLPSAAMAAEGGITFRLILGSKNSKYNLVQQIGREGIEIKELTSKSSEPADPGVPPSVVPEPVEDLSIRSITSTLRVDIEKLDDLLNVVGELVVTKSIILQIAKEIHQEAGYTNQAIELQKMTQLLDRRLGELQEGLIDVRMIPVNQMFDRLVRMVRKLSKDLGKEVNLQISGEETLLDKSMIEEIADPLMHLVRNAMDHGIETKEERRRVGKPKVGIINLRAMQKGSNVVIEVEDDGRGIDLARVSRKAIEGGFLEKDREYSRQDLLNTIFKAGMSTAETITEVSGRGVGMDVVARNITKLSGMIDIDTEEGRGCKFSITLPITLIIIKALIVKVASERYAVPLNSVSESLLIEPGDIQTIEGREVIQLRGKTLALVRLRNLFDLQGNDATAKNYVIVIGLAERRIGLVVDGIDGQQDIVIKSMGNILPHTKEIAGATELGNRKTILVLDSGGLIEEASKANVPVAISS